MPKRVVAVPNLGVPLVDIASRGRKGPGSRIQLGPEQVAAIARTVRKTPEVMVKVSGGAKDTGGAKAHFSYIDRHGKLEIHTDDGLEMIGKGAAQEIVRDWNLDTSRGQYRADANGEGTRPRPKAVHNIVLSMPGRTPPEAVLAAAKQFAREQFASQYRYAMVLHTDQQHPHVHLVVKAEHEFEPKKRLYIRKATLQEWRTAFAAALREHGVAANATPRQVRGRTNTTKKDAIHHRLRALAAHQRLPAAERKSRKPPIASRFMRDKVAAIAKELNAGQNINDPGKEKLAATRESIRESWLATASVLKDEGHPELAAEVERFATSLPPAKTEKEIIADGLLAQIAAQRQGTQRE